MGIGARRLTPAEGRERVQARSSGGVGEGCTIQVLDFAGKTRFLRADVGRGCESSSPPSVGLAQEMAVHDSIRSHCVDQIVASAKSAVSSIRRQHLTRDFRPGRKSVKTFFHFGYQYSGRSAYRRMLGRAHLPLFKPTGQGEVAVRIRRVGVEVPEWYGTRRRDYFCEAVTSLPSGRLLFLHIRL
jgi:hypothetical protein